MDWPAVTAIAAVATAIATAITAILAMWRSIRRPVVTWLKRNALYKGLSKYDLDILKALHDSDTTQISGGYDDTGSPRICTMLDCIPGAPVACRLKASDHYQRSLTHLATHGLLEENTPLDMSWRYLRYDLSQRYVKTYRLTTDGKRFIHKYAVGLHRGEKCIRRWFRGLKKHKYGDRYQDKVDANVRSKLPNLLRGVVWLKQYYLGANSLGADQSMCPSIYEYSPGSRSDEVECIVEIPLSNLDVAKSDRVFLAINTSSKPQYLKYNPKVAEVADAYWIEAVVVKIVKNADPVGTVLNLGQTQEFAPVLENSRV